MRVRPFSVLALTITLAACASIQDTPAQNLALERWQACSRAAPTVRLKEIRPNGEIWVWYEGGSPDLATWRACDAKVLAEQRAADRFAPSSMPHLGIVKK